MPPYGQTHDTWVLYESDVVKYGTDKPSHIVPPSADNREWKIVWRNVILLAYFHVAAIYGAYLFLFKAMWLSNLFAIALYIISALGITAGAHRLWAHKSYQARLPLKILLCTFSTIAFQGSVISWARDHRMHHKYSETDADPHNAIRGFFFSHIGWLLVRKHPQLIAKGHTLDVSDLRSDSVLRFQEKYYLFLVTLACFILPTYIPTLWGESLWNAYFVCAIFRYVWLLNITWLVNSAAHIWGNKAYDKNIKPVELKMLSLPTLGEAFHNYHHIFPWDYKTAELGNYSFNFTKLFIDFMSKIGWAYDLKTVSSDVIQKRVKRTGDGSHPVWGWSDREVNIENKNEA